MSSDDYKKLKKKKLQDLLEDINMGKAPPLQPKKIDGEWRYPLDMDIPDKHMTCPRCGTSDVKDTGKRTIEKKTVFKCPDCKIEFIQARKAKIAWCIKHKQKIVGKNCLGCHVFKLNVKQWIKDYGMDFRCPYHKDIDNVPEDFT